MTIRYSLYENKLTTPPTYTCKPDPKNILGFDEVAALISLNIPNVPESTAKAVLVQLRQTILEELLNGNTVKLDGFVSFVTSMPVRLELPTDPLPTDLTRVDVKGKLSKPFKYELRTQAAFERNDYLTKEPTILNGYDTNSEVSNYITAGQPFTLDGTNISFDPAQSDEGIWITDVTGGFIKQTNLAWNKASRLTFVASLSEFGSGFVERFIAVRTRYTPAGQLREGEYSKRVRSLNLIDITGGEVSMCVIGTGPAPVSMTASLTHADVQFRFVIKPDGLMYISLASAAGQPFGVEQILQPTSADGTVFLLSGYGGSPSCTITVDDVSLLFENVEIYNKYMVETCQVTP
jgi:hypothetical protein